MESFFSIFFPGFVSFSSFTCASSSSSSSSSLLSLSRESLFCFLHVLSVAVVSSYILHHPLRPTTSSHHTVQPLWIPIFYRYGCLLVCLERLSPTGPSYASIACPCFLNCPPKDRSLAIQCLPPLLEHRLEAASSARCIHEHAVRAWRASPSRCLSATGHLPQTSHWPLAWCGGTDVGHPRPSGGVFG